MLDRPRRLRLNDRIRLMVQETAVRKNSLIYPIFIEEGRDIKAEIPSMPGQFRYSADKLPKLLETLANRGIFNVMLFGIPKHKDECGSQAYAENGVIQQAIRQIKKTHPEIYVIGDVCMCEYTSHGHCGIITGEEVDNDRTVKLLSEIALSQVAAGADMVAPSDMMDGRVVAIRKKLDEAGRPDIPIMSYSAKYASNFYGPFRYAAGSSDFKGSRKSYQMDYHNSIEAIKEVELDVSEGADIVMVKPALSYLDIIANIKSVVDRPVAAYSVSGEYSMIKQAAAAGILKEDGIIEETTTSIFRAGADILITYFASEIAEMIDEGRM